jgi:hypothetical protein
MEAEGSLLHSQMPATSPYLKPAQSSPSSFFKIQFNIILHLHPGLPTCYLP